MRRFLLAVLLIIAACGSASAANLTYVDLVRQLTDLEALSALPASGEYCAQCSSYDRASKFDESTGKYAAWDANGDGGGIIREENGMLVIAEMNGPGCIRRIWSAAPGDGRVKIYLDGAAEPVLDMPFKGYFDTKTRPFNYPALVHVVASGWNNYVPIPYRKSCKIVAERNWGAYYHFVYTTFPEGTVVPTFTRDLGAAEATALAIADKTLSDRLGSDPAGARSGQTDRDYKISIPAGRKAVAIKLEGPRAITAIRINSNGIPTDAAWNLLRQITMSIRWDGERNPSVWSPVGDFFGTAPGINAYKSLPLGMADSELYSYWYMPFAKSASIEFANDSKRSVTLEVTVTSAPLSRDIASLGRFHAKWHRDAFLPKEPERWIDWPMLITQGTGRFCGVSLHVFNPKGGWWGEGDEKFWVDGERFPSTFGTGSEDYFGYAWCNPALFQNCFHNQPYNQNSNAGNVSVNRWHIADSVPFHNGFEADIEKYYLNDRPTLYACTAYWYQAAGESDPYLPVGVSERIGYFEYKRAQTPGAVEGEELKVLAKTGGSTQAQDLAGFGSGWSNGAQLWWIEAKPGDKLTLALPVKKTGRYAIRGRFTKAVDYGIVKLYLDDQPLGGRIDLYNDGVVPTPEVALGTVELAAGEHKLTVEIAGANDKAVKAYMFGLDYIKLQGAK